MLDTELLGASSRAPIDATKATNRVNRLTRKRFRVPWIGDGFGQTSSIDRKKMTAVDTVLTLYYTATVRNTWLNTKTGPQANILNRRNPSVWVDMAAMLHRGATCGRSL